MPRRTGDGQAHYAVGGSGGLRRGPSIRVPGEHPPPPSGGEGTDQCVLARGLFGLAHSGSGQGFVEQHRGSFVLDRPGRRLRRDDHEVGQRNLLVGRWSSGDRREGSGGLCFDVGPVAGQVGLAGSTAGPLAVDDRPALEDLAPPHTPRLGPAQRACQALGLDRAVTAERLGPLQLGRSLGEPQVGVARAAREVLSGDGWPPSARTPAPRRRRRVAPDGSLRRPTELI